MGFFEGDANKENILLTLFQDNVDVIPYLIAAVIVVQIIAGSFQYQQIHKSSSTKKVLPYQFVAGIVGALIFNQYFQENEVLNIISFAAIAINVPYLILYGIWSQTKQKKKLRKSVAVGLAFVALALPGLENANVLTTRIALSVISLMMFLYAFPLFSIKSKKKKSTTVLPFPVILAVTFIFITYCLYGVSLEKQMLNYQHLLLALATGVPITLCLLAYAQVQKKSIKWRSN